MGHDVRSCRALRVRQRTARTTGSAGCGSCLHGERRVEVRLERYRLLKRDAVLTVNFTNPTQKLREVSVGAKYQIGAIGRFATHGFRQPEPF